MNTLETVYNKMVEADIRQRQYEETLLILKEELEIFSKKFTKLHRNFGLKFRNEPFDIFYRDEKINILFKGYESISNPTVSYNETLHDTKPYPAALFWLLVDIIRFLVYILFSFVTACPTPVGAISSPNTAFINVLLPAPVFPIKIISATRNFISSRRHIWTRPVNHTAEE